MLRFRTHHQRVMRRGFTLIEAAIVTAIVGIGIVGMLELMAAGTMANAESTELTTALGLVSNVHERCLNVTYDNLFSTFDNRNYSPPVDAKGNSISALSNWSQSVQVNYVDPDRLTVNVPDTQQEPTARISVTVSHNNQMVYTTSWLVSASEWP